MAKPLRFQLQAGTALTLPAAAALGSPQEIHLVVITGGIRRAGADSLLNRRITGPVDAVPNCDDRHVLARGYRLRRQSEFYP